MNSPELLQGFLKNKKHHPHQVAQKQVCSEWRTRAVDDVVERVADTDHALAAVDKVHAEERLEGVLHQPGALQDSAPPTSTNPPNGTPLLI
jgi:hypothetical protein